MKSLLRLTVAAMFSAVMFVSCATTGGVSAFAEKAETMTPENSVVFVVGESIETAWVQINPKYPVDHFFVKPKRWNAVTSPVVPGSCYLIKDALDEYYESDESHESNKSNE